MEIFIEKENKNLSSLELFVYENVDTCAGSTIKFSDFYARFIEGLDPEDRFHWSKRRVSKELTFLTGKYGSNNELYIANVRFIDDKVQGILGDRTPLTISANGRLV